MPKLWTETIEEHRQAVREATLDAAAQLVAERGLASVTMSQIAQRTRIGRATLYKYFSDVEAILVAWHQRHVEEHLDQLARLRDDTAADQRLRVVLEAYALILHRMPHGEVAAVLHAGEHHDQAQRRLEKFIRDLVVEAMKAGAVRDDVPADELANYCLHALEGVNTLTSKTAVQRLLSLTLAGIQPAVVPVRSA